MIILKKHSSFQALNKNNNVSPLATPKRLECPYVEISEPFEHFTYSLCDSSKRKETKANIFDECTVLPEKLFQKYFPDEVPPPQRINIKVVKIKPIKIRDLEQERIEVLFFKCRDLERKEVFLSETRSGKKRFYKGRCFKKVFHSVLLWVMKSWDLAFDGKVDPAFQTIANATKVHRNTAIKHLQKHREMGAIDWDSGKKTYETNTYHLCEAYRELIIPRPKNVTLPGCVHYALTGKILKAKGCYKQKLINHISRENVHHKLIVYLSLRTSLDETLKKDSKTGVDPPPNSQKCRCWNILKPFSFSGKDRAILSSFGEGSLRPAIDDLNMYRKWGKEVTNEIAFLISRCKKHKEKLKTLAKAKLSRNPREALDFTKEYLNTNTKKLRFLKSGKKLNRVIVAENTSPIIDLRLHKEYPELSILNTFQKVGGHWVDRSFTFKQPDVAEAILDYLERSYAKPLRWDKDQLKKPASPQQAEKTLDWCKELLISLKDKLRFLSPGKSVVRDIKAENTAPIVDLKILPTAAERSVLRIYQRINGYWIDKEYTFDQPNLQEDLTKHLEKVLA